MVKTIKNISENTFQALSSLSKTDIIDLLHSKGILGDDIRLTNLFKSDENNFSIHQLNEKDINFLIKVFSDELIIPNFHSFSEKITEITKLVESNCNGSVANYIPELKSVDPKHFAVSICTIDGQCYNFGDSETPFCVQSTCKPINYCIALESLGEAKVHQFIGKEPSGQRFNEVALNKDGLPHNPLINSGAMMCCALIKPEDTIAERFDYVKKYWSQLTLNRGPGFDQATYESEKLTAHRNYALAHLMQEIQAFPKNTSIENTMDLYIRNCSLTLTTSNLSLAAATLANGGINPFSQEKIFSNETIKDCLTIMSFCGMYDFSGEFAFKVGIPAKSGVSGAIMLVIPNVMGICVWSPNLDHYGNSVRGVEFATRLTETFNFHNFDSLVGNSSKIDPRRHFSNANFDI
ncbi:MAG: glutaminase A [Legionellales bacterium]|nr:glutaminase A [Legionellales bacterium]OUX68279.1 MAG: glutaminase A [bacterium TMED178]|tara:strand:- start:986 stop:2206 length:1221 start_codon:yes stop_codon:yes gene_type:complete